MHRYFQWTWALLAMAPLALQAAETQPSASRSNPNQVMAERIAHALHASGQLQGCRIVIEYINGTASLQGTVADAAQVEQAVQLTGQLEGVQKIVNKLEVAPAPAAPSPAVAGQNPHQPTADAQPRPVADQVQLAHRWTYQQPVAPAPSPQTMVAAGPAPATPLPSYARAAPAPVRYDLPHFPAYSWPSYTPYPHYAGVTYPKQYSPTAWPYIGPFYPYPQVPLGWRKVSLEWDDGWWFLDFDD